MCDLDRFVEAQEGDYDRALIEIRGGRKRTHWMWYVFPQIEGLGSSPMAKRYAIRNRREAEAFLAHPILGPRLREIAEAALTIKSASASDVFGIPTISSCDHARRCLRRCRRRGRSSRDCSRNTSMESPTLRR
jgi:uncharacterized protein (DUF1810 family)